MTGLSPTPVTEGCHRPCLMVWRVPVVSDGLSGDV